MMDDREFDQYMKDLHSEIGFEISNHFNNAIEDEVIYNYLVDEQQVHPGVPTAQDVIKRMHRDFKVSPEQDMLEKFIFKVMLDPFMTADQIKGHALKILEKVKRDVQV